MVGRVTLRWFFVIDGRCGVVCVRGSVWRAEKRCGGSNLAAIQVCCCGVAKGIEWMRIERSVTNGTQWRLAGEAYLKAEPRNEALLYAREWVVADGGGVHEWPNLPDWMQWNGVERIEDEWTKLLAATWKVGWALRFLLVTCRTDLYLPVKRLVFLSNRKVRWVLAADMTRNEEIFAAVGTLKGMRLRGTSNEWLATA